jgi:hypothetical protein
VQMGLESGMIDAETLSSSLASSSARAMS